VQRENKIYVNRFAMENNSENEEEGVFGLRVNKFSTNKPVIYVNHKFYNFGLIYI
jgi:hypothetical protein